MSTGKTIGWHEVSFRTGLNGDQVMEYMRRGYSPRPVSPPIPRVLGRRGDRAWLEAMLWSERAVSRWVEAPRVPF